MILTCLELVIHQTLGLQFLTEAKAEGLLPCFVVDDATLLDCCQILASFCFSNCSRCCVFSLVCILMESKPFLCIICTIYNIISASLCCDWLSIFVAGI